MWVEWQVLLLKHFKSSLSPPLFGSDKLQAIAAPTLFLTGSEDAGFDPIRVAARAQKIAGLVGAETIQGCGYMFPINQPEMAVNRVRRFIEDGRQREASG